jgi:hypothetical protein
LMSQKRFDATKIHTHTFGLHDLPTALRYAGEQGCRHDTQTPGLTHPPKLLLAAIESSQSDV